jgi:hypothetical protein
MRPTPACLPSSGQLATACSGRCAGLRCAGLLVCTYTCPKRCMLPPSGVSCEALGILFNLVLILILRDETFTAFGYGHALSLNACSSHMCSRYSRLASFCTAVPHTYLAGPPSCAPLASLPTRVSRRRRQTCSRSWRARRGLLPHRRRPTPWMLTSGTRCIRARPAPTCLRCTSRWESSPYPRISGRSRMERDSARSSWWWW